MGEDGYSTAAETKLLYTSDQGETWEQSTVFEQMLPPRFQKLAFVTGSFGYIVLTSDKTMSSELTHLAITEDGGSSWKTTRTPDTHRLVADGGFVDEQLGFLSYGILTTDEPDLYVTTDGGTNWESATFTMPEAYQIHFVVAETPFYEEGELLVYVRQGSDGDWNGGQSKGLFHSEDQGRTWQFVREVMPDEFD
ncbi:membrane protein [Bacillus sp. JCM 19046]|nr:membrane protein [Bacillus sp. JCM 19046]